MRKESIDNSDVTDDNLGKISDTLNIGIVTGITEYSNIDFKIPEEYTYLFKVKSKLKKNFDRFM